MKLIRFAYQEIRTLLVGISLTFFSSFGQTFLISLFEPHFTETFSLSKSSFGLGYSLVTLGSAATLPYVGKLIDEVPLRRYTIFVVSTLAVASLIVSVSWHFLVLFAGLYLLRLSGQGLSSHTAQTSIARHYTEGRGKALSVINLGYPIGEGIFPLLITYTFIVLSWRTTWGLISGTILFLFLPALLWVLSSSALETREIFKRVDKSSEKHGEQLERQTYRSMITDARFWLLVPAVILPGFWITGLFLYQISIAEQLNWSREIMAAAFVAFAIGRIGSTIAVGPIIDRWSARGVFPYYLIPIGCGLIVAFFHPGTWSAFLYMGFLGITMGASGNLKSALFAELYGSHQLGTARSLYSSVSVFGTALCPFLVGWLLDLNVSVRNILLGAMGTVVIAMYLSFHQLYLKE